MYDGARAAEVAMLLRRLRDRVARDRPLRYIATSATVGDKPKTSREFAYRLFDAPFEWATDDPATGLVRPAAKTAEAAVPGVARPRRVRQDRERRRSGNELLRCAPRRRTVTGDGVAARPRNESRMARLRELLAAGPQCRELADELFDRKTRSWNAAASSTRS